MLRQDICPAGMDHANWQQLCVFLNCSHIENDDAERVTTAET